MLHCDPIVIILQDNTSQIDTASLSAQKFHATAFAYLNYKFSELFKELIINQLHTYFKYFKHSRQKKNACNMLVNYVNIEKLNKK